MFILIIDYRHLSKSISCICHITTKCSAWCKPSIFDTKKTFSSYTSLVLHQRSRINRLIYEDKTKHTAATDEASVSDSSIE